MKKKRSKRKWKWDKNSKKKNEVIDTPQVDSPVPDPVPVPAPAHVPVSGTKWSPVRPPTPSPPQTAQESQTFDPSPVKLRSAMKKLKKRSRTKRDKKKSAVIDTAPVDSPVPDPVPVPVPVSGTKWSPVRPPTPSPPQTAQESQTFDPSPATAKLRSAMKKLKKQRSRKKRDKKKSEVIETPPVDSPVRAPVPVSGTLFSPVKAPTPFPPQTSQESQAKSKTKSEESQVKSNIKSQESQKSNIKSQKKSPERQPDPDQSPEAPETHKVVVVAAAVVGIRVEENLAEEDLDLPNHNSMESMEPIEAPESPEPTIGSRPPRPLWHSGHPNSPVTRLPLLRSVMVQHWLWNLRNQFENIENMDEDLEEGEIIDEDDNGEDNSIDLHESVSVRSRSPHERTNPPVNNSSARSAPYTTLQKVHAYIRKRNNQKSSQSQRGRHNSYFRERHTRKGSKRRHSNRNEENSYLDDSSLTSRPNKRPRFENIEGGQGGRSSNRSSEHGPGTSRSFTLESGSKHPNGNPTNSPHINTPEIREPYVGPAGTTDVSDSDSIISIPVVRVPPEVIEIEDSDSVNGEEEDNFEELQLRIVALEGMLKSTTDSEWNFPGIDTPLSPVEDVGSTGSTDFVPSIENSLIHSVNSNTTTETTDPGTLPKDWQCTTLTPNSIPSSVLRDEGGIDDLCRPPFNLPVQLDTSGTPNRQERPIQTLLSTRLVQEPVRGFHDIDERIITQGHPSPLKPFLDTVRNIQPVGTTPSNFNNSNPLNNGTVARFTSSFGPPHDAFMNQSLESRNNVYAGQPLGLNTEAWPEEINPFALKVWTNPPTTSAGTWSNQMLPHLGWSNEPLNSERNDTFSNPFPHMMTTPTTHSNLMPEDIQSNSNQQWITQSAAAQHSWTSQPELDWNPQMCPAPNMSSTVNSNNSSLDLTGIGYSGQFGALSFPPLPEPVPDPYWNENLTMEPVHPLGLNTDGFDDPPLITKRTVSLPSPNQPGSGLLDPSRIYGTDNNDVPARIISPAPSLPRVRRPRSKRRVTCTENGDLAITKMIPDSNEVPLDLELQSNPVENSDSPRATTNTVNPTPRDTEVDEMRAKLLSDLIEKRTVVISELKNNEERSKASNSVQTPVKNLLTTTRQPSPYSPSRPAINPIRYNQVRPQQNMTSKSPNKYSRSSSNLPEPNSGVPRNQFDSRSPSQTRASRSVTSVFSRVGDLKITIANRRIQPIIINRENDSSTSEDENARVIEARINRFSTDIPTSKPSSAAGATPTPLNSNENEIGQNRHSNSGSSTNTGATTLPPDFQEKLKLHLKNSLEEGYRQVAMENKRKAEEAELEAASKRRKSSDLIPSVVKHLPPARQAEYAILKTKIVEYERAKKKANDSAPISNNLQAKTSIPVAKKNVTAVTSIRPGPTVLATCSKSKIPTRTVPRNSNAQVLNNTQNDSPQNIEIIDCTNNETQPVLCVDVDLVRAIPEKSVQKTVSPENNSSTTSSRSVFPNTTPGDSSQLRESTASLLNNDVIQSDNRGIATINSQIDSLLQSCTGFPTSEVSASTAGDVTIPTPTPSDMSSNTTQSSLYNSVVDEHQEHYLREKLVKAALMRKMETSSLRLKLAKSENELLNTRATTLQGANTLMEKARRISDNKLIYRNMIARVAELREQLLKADQELGLNKLTVQGMITEFTESCNELQGNVKVCEKLSQECRQFGTQLEGKKYKLPDRGAVEMVTRLKEIQTHADSLKVDSMTGDPTPGMYLGRGFGRGRRGSPIRGRGRGRGRGQGDSRQAGASTNRSSGESNSSQTNGKRNPYPWLTKHTTLGSPGDEEEVYLLPRLDFGNCIGTTLVDSEPVEMPFLQSFQPYHPLLPRENRTTQVRESSDTTSDPTPSIDPEVTLCTFELQGMCHSEDCTFQHLDRSPPQI